MPALRREPARVLTPRTSVRVYPLQHYEMPALRRRPTRRLLPRAAVLAQRLQLFELDYPNQTVN